MQQINSHGYQLDLSQCLAFVRIAQTSSFSRAAEQLHLTQSAISKRVQALESQLGVQLFDRIQKTVTLTEAGRALLPKAEALLLASQDMQRFASSLSESVAGPLSIATSHHIGLRRLPPTLAAYRRAYPDVNLDIRFEDSELAISAVLSGEFELAVVTLPRTLPALIKSQQIWQDPLHIVRPIGGAPNSQSNAVTAVDLAQLLQQPCVLPETNTYTYSILQEALDPYALTPKVAMHNNFLETIKMLVVAGFGWSVLPETLIDESVAIVKTTPTLRLSRQLGLVYHENRSLSNPAKAFISTLNSLS